MIFVAILAVSPIRVEHLSGIPAFMAASISVGSYRLKNLLLVLFGYQCIDRCHIFQQIGHAVSLTACMLLLVSSCCRNPRCRQLCIEDSRRFLVHAVWRFQTPCSKFRLPIFLSIVAPVYLKICSHIDILSCFIIVRCFSTCTGTSRYSVLS